MTDRINQLVRPYCAIILISTFCLVFMWGVYAEKPVIGSDAFCGVMGVVLTWWFKSRDEKNERDTTNAQVNGNPPPSGSG